MNIEGKTVLNDRAIASMRAEIMAKDKEIAKLNERLNKIEKMIMKNKLERCKRAIL